jgi:AraC-like DNA-binding protein
LVDPLAEVITLLTPRALYSKVISGAGAWAVRYSEFGQPSFCTMLEGDALLTVNEEKPITLQAGDFVLMPATPGFTLSGLAPAAPTVMDPKQLPAPEAEIRHGRQSGAADMRMLGGYFAFESPDAALMVSLLPSLLHVRGIERLPLLVQLVREESLAQRPGRELVLGRLIEVLLIEALRSAPAEGAPPGLLRALADPRLAAAMRHIHGDPARAWTVVELARTAALSRSAFFERFSRAVGLAPMAYLLAWRMAMAKDLLKRSGLALAEVAERVGYSSASTFSTAFSRHVGQAPGRYAASTGRPR